ncbi:MAG: glycosyltransferase family 117 protein [Candidatus Limnocylindrales bacterium]
MVRQAKRLVDGLAPWLVGLVAVVAARQAMLPGLGFWDTAELQVVAPVMGTAHPTGFPTYVLLGWLANLVLSPFGEPAFRMNLFAGLCVGVAAGVTVSLVRALTRSTVLGVMAGLGLAVTPSVWAIGTRAEAHALHLALVAILFRLLVGWEEARRGGGGASADRWLVAAAVMFGLSVGNHSLTLLLALPVGLFVLAVDPAILRQPRLILTCVGVLAVTVLAVFLELPLRAGPFRAPLVYGHPETWEGFWYVVLAQQFQGSLIDPFGDLAGKAALLASRTVAQFGVLAVFVPAGFIVACVVRPRYALLSGLAVAVTVFFAASYENADIGRYYLGPILIAWTWLAIGASAIVSGTVGAPGRLADERWTAPTVRTAVAALLAVLLLVPSALAAPGRFDALDASRETDAPRWVDLALLAMEPDAVVVSWWSYSTPLWYAQHIQGRRTDITIVDDRTRLDEALGEFTDVIDANLGVRPVYVIRDDPREVALLAERYVLEPIGGPDARFLTRVVARREPAS